MIKSKRIHDKFYIKEKTKIKESFKFLLKSILRIKFNSLIDIGCANGSFLNFIKKKFKNKKLVGADIDSNLLFNAKNRNNDIEFTKLDISKKIKNKLIEKYDIVVMSGVHTIYDDIAPLIKNASLICKKGGYFLMFGSFNPSKFDILTRVKEFKSNTWETGFNRPSLLTTRRLFNKFFSSSVVSKFNFNLKIKKNKQDPRRTYTIALKSNKLLTINGLEQISTKFLIIGKK